MPRIGPSWHRLGAGVRCRRVRGIDTAVTWHYVRGVRFTDCPMRGAPEMESFELDACIDCTLTIAGYDDTETGRDLSASRAGLERMSADNGGADVILSPATDPEWSEPIDEFFSGAPCDVCLSPLGGTRVLHDVVVLPFRPIDSAAV